jgi:hypothetical protein
MRQDAKPEQLAEVFDVSLDELGMYELGRLVVNCAKRGQKTLALCTDSTVAWLKGAMCEPQGSDLELENLGTGETTIVTAKPLSTEEQFNVCVVRIANCSWWDKTNLINGTKMPFSLEERLCAQVLARIICSNEQKEKGHDYGLVIVDGEAKHFDWLAKQCAQFEIAFAKAEIGASTGCKKRGENTEAEEVFTPLSSWDIPPLEMIVDELLIAGGVHVFAGLFESYKSMFGLELSSGVMEGRKVADRFEVNEKYAGTEVVWVNCDQPHGVLLSYAKNFGLDQDDRFVSNSPGVSASLAVDSPALVKAVRGKLLFVDTMLDLARIKDAGQSGEWVEFFAKVRDLINVHGCLAVVLISHPTKSGARSSSVDPSEYLKDSVTFGGKIDVGFGFRRVGEGEVHVERIKGRGFERPIKFSLATHDEDGKSWISRGRFPAFCEGESLGAKLKAASRKGAGRGMTDEEKALASDCLKRGLSSRKAAEELAEKLGSKVSDSTVFRFWKGQSPQEDLDF